MKVKGLWISLALFVVLAVPVFAQAEMIILGKGETYRGRPDGVYGEYDILGRYIASVYYVTDGECRKEERLDRYGKLRAVIHYRSGMPGEAEFFTDGQDFIRDVRDSMNDGSRMVSVLLLVSLIGVLFTKGLFGLSFWTGAYLVLCVVFLEGLVHILLKGLGLSYSSPFFNYATVLQLICFCLAFFYLLRGMVAAFQERKDSAFFILIGAAFTVLSAFLNLASFYEHWGLSEMLVTHVKSFLFTFLFSAALMLRAYWSGRIK